MGISPKMATLIFIIISVFGDQAKFNNLNLIQKPLVTAEIIDLSECSYIFNKKEHIERDIWIVWGRINSLRGTPKMCWAGIWPDYKTTRAKLARNRGYTVYLQGAIKLYEGYPKGEIFKLALEDNLFLNKVWESVEDIHNPYHEVPTIRISLGKLKVLLDKIDESWFYSGILPEAVPMWSYSRIEQ